MAGREYRVDGWKGIQGRWLEGNTGYMAGREYRKVHRRESVTDGWRYGES